MEKEKLDFSFDMSGIDRRAILGEAAQRLDSLQGDLGPGAELTETPEGELARALREDVAEFSGFPVVHRIIDKDFLTKKLQVPVRFQQLTRNYNFHWLYFPIALFPQRNWAFSRLEVAVELSPEEHLPHLRPKAYHILPEQAFQTLLEMSDHLEVKLDESGEFKAKAMSPELKAKYLEGKLGGYVDVKAAAGLGLVVGPFVYQLKKAKIQHTPVGMEKVFWRLDGKEFFQDNCPALVVVVQTPKETKEVKIRAAMQAYRNFSVGAAGLLQAVKELGKVLRGYFQGGVPLRDEKEWDITPRL
jgi:hypothetical protein